MVLNGEPKFTRGLFPGCERFIAENRGAFDRILPLKGQLVRKKARVLRTVLDLLFVYFFPASEEALVAHLQENGPALAEVLPTVQAGDTDLRLCELLAFVPVNRPLIRGFFAANVLVGSRRDLAGKNPRRPPLPPGSDPQLSVFLSLEESFLLAHFPEYLPMAQEFYLKKGLSLYQFFPLDRCKGIDDQIRLQVSQL